MLRTERLPRVSRPAAITVFCLVAGFAGEALFHRARLGINFTIFIALASIVHAAFTVGAATVARRVIVSLLPAAASVPMFWFDTQWARFFALPMSIAWLLLVPRLVEHGFSLRVFGRLPERAAEAVVRVVPAFGRTVTLPWVLASNGTARGARTIVTGLALGVPSALVFMLLFSFDAKFSRVLLGVGRRSDDVVGFVIWSIVIALALTLLVTVDELRAVAKPTTPVATKSPEPYRTEPHEEPAAVVEIAPRKLLQVTPGAWSLVLIQVATVFALYVALHAQELFASHRYIQSTTGVTYANHLHGGFFALLVATCLSVGLVLVGHVLFAKKREALDASSRRLLLGSELSLVALGIPTLASCAQKLALYVEAYGQTYLRLGVAIAVVVTFTLLVLTIAKTIRPTWNGYGASVTATTMGVLTLASFFDADAHVARVNVSRALADKPFHAEYVAWLGDRALVGLADAKPTEPAAYARWRELVVPVAAEWDREGSHGRSYRRKTSCEATLGAPLCEESRALPRLR